MKEIHWYDDRNPERMKPNLNCFYCQTEEAIALDSTWKCMK